jgi:adenosine deaminase
MWFSAYAGAQITASTRTPLDREGQAGAKQRGRDRADAIGTVVRFRHATALAIDVTTIDKAELHCHIDGILDPQLAAELNADGIELGDLTELAACFPVDSLHSWLTGYCRVVDTYHQPRDQRLVAILERHVRRLRLQRVVYAEIFVSSLLSAREDLGALVDLFADIRSRVQAVAQPTLQVELVVCIGRAPPDRVQRQMPRILALWNAGLIRGVALAGDETRFRVAPLSRCFATFRDAGMGIEIHAGELGGVDSVRDAIEYGFPHRLGHGLAVFDDPMLVDLVCERGIHLEFCPTSNLRLGAVAALDRHPLKRAYDLGMSFSINTDDPGPFECSMTSELQLVADRFDFGAQHFERILSNTLAASFAARIP